MKTYEDVAKEVGLDEQTTARFVAYMRERWANQETLHCAVGYAQKWAQRFKDRIEWEASDATGRMLLRKGAPC